jgi:hypothetical protein
MPEINHVDPDIKKYSDTLKISIQACLNGFSFCIYASEHEKILAFRHYNFTQSEFQEDFLNSTSEILFKDELLRLSYSKVSVIFTGKKSTLVPEEFFKVENLKSILEFNQPIDELDEIYYNSVPGCQSKLVFTIPSYFTSQIIDKFPQAVFFNQATPLLNSVLADKEKSQTDHVIVQMNKDFFDLIITQEGKLKLYNTFLYVNATDLVYFLLYASKQIKIDIKKSKLYFLGEHSTRDSLSREIAHYLPSLECFEKANLLPWEHISKKLDINRFFTLLYLSMCE